MALKVAIAVLVSEVAGVRHRQKRQRGGVPAFIDGLYTFGAPSSSDPPLMNRQCPTGCFPGYRTWNVKKKLIGSTVDIIVSLSGVAGYKHLYQDGMQLVVNKGTHQVFPCSAATNRLPNGFKRKRITLHFDPLYVEKASQVNQFMYNISHIGLKHSYVKDKSKAAKEISRLGWRLVDTATHDGKGSAGGKQVSHLIQQPSTLECMVTFQGTQSLGDVFADIDIRKVSYCGLPQQVHAGFRDHLNRITRSDVWQRDIKSHLPSCSKVYVVGHSLGGAMSELFSACVQNAPKAGTKGHMDYTYIGWTKGTSKQLPYVALNSGSGQAKSGKGAALSE